MRRLFQFFIFLRYARDLSFPLRMIHFPRDRQSFKCVDQLQEIIDSVGVEFRANKSELRADLVGSSLNGFDVYQYRTDEDLVSNVYISTEIFSGLRGGFGIGGLSFDDAMKVIDGCEIITRTVLCLYSVFTKAEYRGSGCARNLIYDAVRSQVNFLERQKRGSIIFSVLCWLRDTFDLGKTRKCFFMDGFYEEDVLASDDYVIALHLNPADTMMNFNYALYYSLGFRQASFVEYGPSYFIVDVEKMSDFHDARLLVQNPEICTEKGGYFCMVTSYSNFLKNCDCGIESDLIQEGEILRNILLNRVSA